MSSTGIGFSPETAIVTGASRGIGRATALSLAQRGVRVVLAARASDELLATEREIRDSGGDAMRIEVDISAGDGVRAMVDETSQKWGPIDLLVNNAGTVHRAPVLELTESSWDRQMDVNLKGTFLCSQAVLSGMISLGRGRIVNVSSISGTLGTPQLSGYCASKWGVLGLTKALAEELRSQNIQIFAVCPGSVNTEMLQKGLPGAKPQMEPEDVARIIVYLATDAPNAMTGAAVDVFG